MDIVDHIKETKQTSRLLASIDESTRNAVLCSLAVRLRAAAEEILKANSQDVAKLSKDDPMYDRLLLTPARIQAMADDVEAVVALPSPIGSLIESKKLDNGLLIQRVTVPLGLIAVIYEARPNVTIDVFTLCFKTGNATVLKGGKEAHHSNEALAAIIQGALCEHGIDPRALYLVPPTRQNTAAVLGAVGLVDVCIPRGSQALINFVREQARVPVIETGAGIVHTYFDVSGDLKKGQAIIHNAKTRRVSVCNALDCLIIHQERLGSLPELVGSLASHHVEIFADRESYQALSQHYPKELLHCAKAEHFGQEFLSYKMAIKTAASVQEAIAHIHAHTSGHSEAIIAEDATTAALFLEQVDAAAVYVNASTAFTDGGQFGLGAEIGISTQKLHARGPMGLAALTSYKWLVHGNGHTRK